MAQKFCTACGAQLSEDCGFCTQCGAAIVPAAPQQPTAEQAPNPQPTAEQAAYQQNQQQPYAPQAPYQQAPQQPTYQMPYQQAPNPPYQQAPQQPMNPQGGYYYPPNGYPNPAPYGAQPYVMMKPKIPGRGLGIASMVLAILSLVFSLSFLSVIDETMSEYEDYCEEYQGYPSYLSEIDEAYEEEMVDQLISICVFTVLPILAVVFGFCAKARGYRCGVSTAGLIMGFIGLVGSASAIVLAVLQIV